MSELKVYRDPKDGPAYREFYEKSEADKVIAEPKDEIRNLRHSLIIARHEVAKARGKFSNKCRVKLKDHK